MPQIHLDTRKLRLCDERALGVLYRSIESLRRKPLTPQEVFSIYQEGITVLFGGNGLNFAPELNYALFYCRIRMRSPVLLTLTCFADRGESHEEVIEHGPAGKLIVAGTVRNGSFTGVSTTWMKHVQPESGTHALGLFMNDLLLDCYHIERTPSWSDQDAEMWEFA